MKILVVEDERSIRNAIKIFFEAHSFVVEQANNGLEAVSMCNMTTYDCLVLDLNLPGLDGLSVSRKLRASNISTPIIMLTARVQLYDKLAGFENGADDYLTKPFELKELLARVNALIKRNSQNKSKELRFDNFELLPNKNIVKSDKGSIITLGNKEMGILEYLIRNKGNIVSTEEILEHVWDSQVNDFTQTVKTHIKTLRQKIDKKKKIIKTVRGKGYIVE